jgi:hypothetical protein
VGEPRCATDHRSSAETEEDEAAADVAREEEEGARRPWDKDATVSDGEELEAVKIMGERKSGEEIEEAVGQNK